MLRDSLPFLCFLLRVFIALVLSNSPTASLSTEVEHELSRRMGEETSISFDGKCPNFREKYSTRISAVVNSKPGFEVSELFDRAPRNQIRGIQVGYYAEGGAVILSALDEMGVELDRRNIHPLSGWGCDKNRLINIEVASVGGEGNVGVVLYFNYVFEDVVAGLCVFSKTVVKKQLPFFFGLPMGRPLVQIDGYCMSPK